MDRISPLLNKLGFWHLPAVCTSLLLPQPKDSVDLPLNSTLISYSNRLEVNYTCCPLTSTLLSFVRQQVPAVAFLGGPRTLVPENCSLQKFEIKPLYILWHSALT